MSQHEGCPAPDESVPLELQAAEHGGGRGEGVEGAAPIVDVAVLDQFGGADRPARLVLAFDHEDIPAGVSQEVRCHEAVRPGADHHGVGGHHSPPGVL